MPRLDPETGLKVCSKCEKDKPANAFSSHKGRVDRLASWCRECRSADWQTKKPDNILRGTRMIDPDTGMKVCSRCEESKPASDFTFDRARVENLGYWCFKCRSTVSSAYHAANYLRIAIKTCYPRAAKRGVPCSITEKDLSLPDNCPLCGCLLQVGRKVDRRTNPSIDVYDPKLGYVPGNVWILCMGCNKRKQDMSGEDHVAFGIKLIDAFKEHCA